MFFVCIVDSEYHVLLWPPGNYVCRRTLRTLQVFRPQGSRVRNIRIGFLVQGGDYVVTVFLRPIPYLVLLHFRCSSAVLVVHPATVRPLIAAELRDRGRRGWGWEGGEEGSRRGTWSTCWASSARTFLRRSFHGFVLVPHYYEGP